MMRYDDFSYLWPPRPEHTIDPSMLHVFEKRGWVAQLKKNGTASVIAVAPDKSIIAMNRHNEVHKAWTPTADVMKRFTTLSGNGWFVFVAELMHNKVAGLRDINYINDILVNDGEYLVGVTQEDRQDMLHDLFLDGSETETKTHIVVDENIWLPLEYESGFSTLFNSLTQDEDEGLVLKDPKAKLTICSRQKSNTAGQVKCRKTGKNYSF